MIYWGFVVIGLSLIAWGGQTLSWLAPDTAVRLGVMEAESDVEPTYWADVQGEARWDAFTLWTMLVAGVLLVFDQATWAYFGLVGGGMYVYFAGRGIVTRAIMMRRGLRVGAPGNVRVGIVFLVVWGVMGLITLIAAGGSLST
ncbi:MAG: hypothetical protein OER12_04890 [Acidimicrobiia bacterium]|nr:hypothetical protein [Acidimicrobiia bacterium]